MGIESAPQVMNEQTPRVLILAQRLPMPIRSGLDLRTLAIAKALARFASVQICGLWGASTPAPPSIDSWVRLGEGAPRNPTTLFSHFFAVPGQPFAHWFDPEIADTLRAQVATFAPTHIVASRIHVWDYIRDLRQTWRGPVILDLDEVHETLMKEPLSNASMSSRPQLHDRITKTVSQFEHAAVNEANAVWVSSEREAEHVQVVHGHQIRCVVVPNSLDLDDYPLVDLERDDRALLFPGNFAYPPNQLAARELIDTIAPALPDYRITIAGSHMPTWLTNARSDQIRVVSPVDRMQDELARAGAAVLPIRAGGGTRLKVLESLAMRTPVVATPKAVEGLDVEAGRHLEIADSPDAVIEQIRQMARDHAGTRDRVDAGRRFVEERYSIPALTQRIQAHWPGDI